MRHTEDIVLTMLIVDPDPLAQRGVASLLDSVSNWRYRVVADDDLLPAAITEDQPDLALVAVQHVGTDEIRRIRLLKSGGVRVLAYGPPLTPTQLRRLIGAGIDGYINQSISEQKLISAIKACAAGQRMLLTGNEEEELMRALRLIRADKPKARSTPTVRENEVLACVAEGMSNAEIAAHLGISIGTVKAHIGHLLRKYGYSSRTQLAIQAAKGHLVSRSS